MKRIVIIPSWFPTLDRPLNGSFFKEQAEFLNQSTVAQFIVMYGDERSTPFLKFIWVYFLSLIKIKWPISDNLVLQNLQTLEFVIPKNRRVSEKYRLKLSRRLYRKSFLTLLSKGFHPDLIHSQSGMDAGIFSHEISKTFQIPFVIFEHQVFVFHHYSRLKSKLVLDAFKSANKTAAVSNDERRQILMNQPNCNPVVIPNLVDESKFVNKRKNGNSYFQIITFMYANPIKGYITFFESMKEIRQVINDFNFIVVGNGIRDGFDVFEGICKEFGLLENATFIPMISRDEVGDLLQKQDLYVCTSDFETFGIAPREAMMCGLPVVSTANGGVEDCITADTGLLVPVKDPSAMADAILRIRNNELIYDPQKIRDFAIKNCGRETFLKAMVNFYTID